MSQDAFFAKSRVNTLGWSKTRNRALLGHPRRCGVRWGGVRVLECGMGKGNATHSPCRRQEMTTMPLGARRMSQDAFFAKSRVNTLGLPKTRNRPLLGHPRRYGVRWGCAGRWSVRWRWCSQSARRGEPGCVDAPSPSPEKKSGGLHPNASASAF